MSTKTISITVEAYERLKSWKEKNESFSDVINKIGGRRRLSDFAGVLSDKTANEIREGIKKDRSRSRKRYIGG
ncbi:MAG: antitoxin VapB family protein [Candidatus Woesearchaeota archaeon]